MHLGFVHNPCVEVDPFIGEKAEDFDTAVDSRRDCSQLFANAYNRSVTEKRCIGGAVSITR